MTSSASGLFVNSHYSELEMDKKVLHFVRSAHHFIGDINKKTDTQLSYIRRLPHTMSSSMGEGG